MTHIDKVLVGLSAVTAVLLTGCIGIKDDRAVKTISTGSEIARQEAPEVLSDRGFSAKLTPDRGQMLMELLWWNKRQISQTLNVHKKDVVYKTMRIGFFPGVCTGEVMTDTPVVGHLWCCVANIVYLFTPTILSMVYGPWMSPADTHSIGSSFTAWGLFGNFCYLDHKNPKIMREYAEQKVEKIVKEEPIRLMDFDVEIDGRVFHGENGVAYIGAVVGDKTVLDVKVLSFAPPAGFSTNGVASAFGSTFRVRVPTEAEVAMKAEQKRLQEVALAQQIQAERAAAAARAAAQQAATMAMVNATVQGINASAAALNGGTYVPPSPVVPIIPAVSTPPASGGTSSAVAPKLQKSCPGCYGSGRCRPCNGTGKNPAKKYTNGRLYDTMVPENCRPCNGTGNCLTCGGKGHL